MTITSGICLKVSPQRAPPTISHTMHSGIRIQLQSAPESLQAMNTIPATANWTPSITETDSLFGTCTTSLTMYRRHGTMKAVLKQKRIRTHIRLTVSFTVMITCWREKVLFISMTPPGRWQTLSNIIPTIWSMRFHPPYTTMGKEDLNRCSTQWIMPSAPELLTIVFITIIRTCPIAVWVPTGLIRTWPTGK